MNIQMFARVFCVLMVAGVVGVLCPVRGMSQGVVADRITTTITLDAQDSPFTVTHVYEFGRTQTTYTTNGTYTESAARGLGALLSVVVFGTTTNYAIIDNETTPGTGRTALVSFTSATEGDGSKTGIIIIDEIVN